MLVTVTAMVVIMRLNVIVVTMLSAMVMMTPDVTIVKLTLVTLGAVLMVMLLTLCGDSADGGDESDGDDDGDSGGAAAEESPDWARRPGGLSAPLRVLTASSRTAGGACERPQTTGESAGRRQGSGGRPSAGQRRSCAGQRGCHTTKCLLTP